MTNQKSIDAPSLLGQFGWEQIGSDEYAIPVIVRSNNVRYSPVKIVEQEIIKKYDAIPQAVFQCISLKSFYLTAMEAKLLNDINFNHCNNRYGEGYFTTRDVIISAADVKHLSRFLNISHLVFTQGISSLTNKVGIVRLAIDPQDPNYKMSLPYVVKTGLANSENPAICVPAKLVESFVTNSGTSVRVKPTEWDILYLKMLSIYCENNSLAYITPDSYLITLDGLLYSKTNTPVVYEQYKSRN